jgi:hypothetical protein
MMMFNSTEFGQAPGSAGMLVEEPSGYGAVTIGSVEEAMEILRSAHKESAKKDKKDKKDKKHKVRRLAGSLRLPDGFVGPGGLRREQVTNGEVW